MIIVVLYLRDWQTEQFELCERDKDNFVTVGGKRNIARF